MLAAAAGGRGRRSRLGRPGYIGAVSYNGAPMGVTDDLLRNNERYAAERDRAELPRRPAKRLAVVACMDARIDVHRILGLEEGDAHVIRNAGGVVTEDTVRSLAVSQRILGTEEVVLIQHTDCGMLGFDDDDFRRRLADETGVEPAWQAEPLADLEEGVRGSIARVRESPFVPHTDDVRGFVYDVESGALREVRA